MKIYTYQLSYFPESTVNLINLTKEIRESSISVSLDHIDSENTEVLIYFKSDLNDKDKMALDTIISTHDNIAKSSTVMDVNIIPENKKFMELGDLTNDMYKAESWTMDIVADVSTQTFDFIKPYNISLLAAEIKTLDKMITDEMDVFIAPDTIIGIVSSSSVIGDTSINVSNSVSDNLIPGRYLNFNDIEYEVINVDHINNIITLNKSLENDIITGTYCKMNIKIINSWYIHTIDTIEIGKSITTGQRIPKNTTVRIKYKNNSGIAKKVAFFVEYLY